MKENEATIFLLELLRDEYQFEETFIKKHYHLINEERIARLIIAVILNLKTMLLSLPNGNKITKEAINIILSVLTRDTNTPYKELMTLVSIKSTL